MLLIYLYICTCMCGGVCSGFLNVFLFGFFLCLHKRGFSFLALLRVSEQDFFISFYRRKMAQASAPATSIRDEDSSESRMVVTFLMSALESMVSRVVKQLHHNSVLAHAGLHQYPASCWGAEKV